MSNPKKFCTIWFGITQKFLFLGRSLALCRGKLIAVIAQLMCKCFFEVDGSGREELELASLTNVYLDTSTSSSVL